MLPEYLFNRNKGVRLNHSSSLYTCQYTSCRGRYAATITQVAPYNTVSIHTPIIDILAMGGSAALVTILARTMTDTRGCQLVNRLSVREYKYSRPNRAVSSWMKSIQAAATKFSRDVSSGTASASQETNFRLSLERALEGIEAQLRTEEVNMVMGFLRNAKRFHTTVSFIADTGLNGSAGLGESIQCSCIKCASKPVHK